MEVGFDMPIATEEEKVSPEENIHGNLTQVVQHENIPKVVVKETKIFQEETMPKTVVVESFVVILLRDGVGN